MNSSNEGSFRKVFYRMKHFVPPRDSPTQLGQGKPRTTLLSKTACLTVSSWLHQRLSCSWFIFLFVQAMDVFGRRCYLHPRYQMAYWNEGYSSEDDSKRNGLYAAWCAGRTNLLRLASAVSRTPLNVWQAVIDSTSSTSRTYGFCIMWLLWVALNVRFLMNLPRCHLAVSACTKTRLVLGSRYLPKGEQGRHGTT